jgi:bifunctional non-homologous end joining protein LigD
MTLASYRKKRSFGKTPEPKGRRSPKKTSSRFVIQKHHARNLHYDFRLEVDGVLKSWAIPKGLPKRAKDKRLAVQTEDHPLEYLHFEGEIPEGHYGAGTVEIWDEGKFLNLKKELSLKSALKRGQVEIYLEGKKYKGGYALIHFKEKNWLIIKMKVDTVRKLYES